jgi:hypothetical protein
MNDVTLFRLHSGEEIIAKVTEKIGDNAWAIKTPAILIPIGEGKLGMAPWLPYCNTDGMILTKDAIAFTVAPKKELANNYNSSFGSGIVVPEKELQDAPPLRLITE